MSNASHLTAYVWSLDGEDFPYESLENLLSANPTLSAGSTVFYGVPVAPVPADFVDASRIFQDIQADAQAAFGDCAKDYAKTVAPEAMADLQNMLEAWLLESLGLPNCYSVTHVASYSISSHDLP